MKDHGSKLCDIQILLQKRNWIIPFSDFKILKIKALDIIASSFHDPCGFLDEISLNIDNDHAFRISVYNIGKDIRQCLLGSGRAYHQDVVFMRDARIFIHAYIFSQNTVLFFRIHVLPPYFHSFVFLRFCRTELWKQCSCNKHFLFCPTRIPSCSMIS